MKQHKFFVLLTLVMGNNTLVNPPVAQATEAIEPLGLIVGDAMGNVVLLNLASGEVIRSTNLNNSPIGRIDIFDLQEDGTNEAVVTHFESEGVSSYALLLPELKELWHTDRSTSFNGLLGFESFGLRHYHGDFNNDGLLEILIPSLSPLSDSIHYVFSTHNGSWERTVPQTHFDFATVYINPTDGHHRLVVRTTPDAFTPHLRVYDMSDPTFGSFCENQSVNMWLKSAVAQSMIDGLPRIWGGWYGRTLYVVDGDCNSLWSRSYGGAYEASAVYGGDLRGDGVEALLVGGTTGTTPVRIDAVSLQDGAILWTFTDHSAYWSAHVIGTQDVNGDGSKEVIVAANNPIRKYAVLNGSTGEQLWEQAYSESLKAHARFADIDFDGRTEVLLAVGSSIEARDVLDGSLKRTYPFDGDVNSFEVLTIAPIDADSDGVPDSEDDCAGSDLNETIVIGECETGITNELFEDGCSVLDLIGECLAGASNHGEYVRCVGALARDWRQAGLITYLERVSIIRCVARSNGNSGPKAMRAEPTNGEDLKQ